jgi:hypothetical protein
LGFSAMTPLDLRSSDLDWITLMLFRGIQGTNSESWNSSASITVYQMLIINSYSLIEHICIYMCWLFLFRTLMRITNYIQFFSYIYL